MSDTEDALQPITLRPIGVIRSSHRQPEATPIHPIYARGVRGQAEILPEYADGLRDLEGASHVFLIYRFHKAAAPRLIVKPFLDDATHGVFATRAPCRPNRMGISVVRLVQREANVLHIEDLDILDGTPLLDIKPYVTDFEYRENAGCGWQDDVDERAAQTRGRRRFREGAEGA